MCYTRIFDQRQIYKTMRRILFLTTFLLTVDRGSMQSVHTQCSYIEDNMFTCDYTAMTSSSDRPIDYSHFSPEPQRIEVVVNGLVPFFGDTQVFTPSFANIDVSLFNENYPATLVVDCEGSTVLLSEDAFLNMSHVQHLTIRNCGILNLPNNVFVGFENLDYFNLEGGYIDTMDVNAFVGLNIEQLSSDDHTIPRNLGKFESQYTKFPDSVIPPGLLYNMKNLTSVIMRGNGISTVSVEVFRYNTNLKHIDLSDNDFTSIPDSIFNNLNALTEVRMENIQWHCTCSNAWFVTFVRDRNITLYGDFICSNSDGDTVFGYYHTNCESTDPCEGTIGFVIGSQCETIFAMIISSLAVIACIITVVALIIILQSTSAYKARDRKRRQAVGHWSQVIDRTISRSKNL